jgi:hypothetical protein
MILKFSSDSGRMKSSGLFCFGQCQCFKLGCAAQCEIRKRLGIPPFGKSYLGKLKGEIK